MGTWEGVSHSEELIRVFHLGPEDLARNRAGRLGPNQVRRLRRAVWWNLGAAALIVLGLLAIFGLVAERPYGWTQYLVVSLMVAAGIALGFFTARSLRRAVAAGVVECRTGPVSVTMRGRSGMWLAVDGRSYQLPVRFWHVGSGRPYRVYVAPAANRIVAMEPDGWDTG
jgi:hypothetical protein